jgi:hypothetical protein
MNKATKTLQQLAASILAAVPSVVSRETARCLLLYVEAASYTLLRRRILSTIAVCSIVWLASVWRAGAIAEAQETPSNNPGLTATELAIAQRSIEKPEARHLVFSMVDRSALRNSAAQSTNPTDEQNTGEVRPPTNLRGAEFASLATLAAAPASSLLYSIKAKDSGQADTSSLTNDNKALVYQVGTISFVVNRLPNSFSVSSPGNSLSDAR